MKTEGGKIFPSLNDDLHDMIYIVDLTKDSETISHHYNPFYLKYSNCSLLCSVLIS